LFICSLSLFVLNIPTFINSDSNGNWSSFFCCLSPLVVLFPTGIISTYLGIKSQEKIREKNSKARQKP